tara:strand:- start:6309 stop:6722 length:414 start_codon:yes stop_codon:yes gene_type:complete
MAITISKPTIGGSEGTWGQTINTGLTAIESTFNGSGTGKATVAPDLSTLTINGANVTSTAGELNLLDGSAENTVVNSKAVVYGSAGQVQATTVDLGDWTITQSGTSLKFAYQGTNRFSLSSSGALTVENNITAYGSA